MLSSCNIKYKQCLCNQGVQILIKHSSLFLCSILFCIVLHVFEWSLWFKQKWPILTILSYQSGDFGSNGRSAVRTRATTRICTINYCTCTRDAVNDVGHVNSFVCKNDFPMACQSCAMNLGWWTKPQCILNKDLALLHVNCRECSISISGEGTLSFLDVCLTMWFYILCQHCWFADPLWLSQLDNDLSVLQLSKYCAMFCSITPATLLIMPRCKGLNVNNQYWDVKFSITCIVMSTSPSRGPQRDMYLQRFQS